jgi:hypothetical protein
VSLRRIEKCATPSLAIPLGHDKGIVRSGRPSMAGERLTGRWPW